MDTSMTSLLSYLEQEKLRAQDRIQQCQVFLNDPDLDLGHADLRESLDSILQHAEDDFGSFLHLITVLKKVEVVKGDTTGKSDRSKRSKKEVETIGPYGDGALEMRGSRSSRSNSKDHNELEDFDPLKQEDEMFTFGDHDDEDFQMKRQPSADPETEEERKEEEDVVPGYLSRPLLPGTSAANGPRGRMIAGRASQRLGGGGGTNIARSLPVSVPLPERPQPPIPNFPPELDSEDVDTPDILSSMQMIAKSLHANAATVMGELPMRPSRALFKTSD